MSVAERGGNLDAIIVGGGIAGLWTLDALRRAGHACLLIEREALGAGQTIWSQGIIHGGLKYTLSGLMNPSAEAIRDMPGVWRACLSGGGGGGGEDGPDLSAAALRAPHCHLWQTSSLASRLGMIGARAGLRISPVVLEREDRPEVLRECPGIVARLDEQVIDPAAVMRVFAARNQGFVCRGNVRAISPAADGVRVSCDIGAASPEGLCARRLILAAGNGNAALRKMAGLPDGRTQVRPLRMVLVRGGRLPILNGHCVDGARTRVTITTARDAAGRAVWQVGGEIAEQGAAIPPAELIRLTAAELLAVIPRLDLDGCEWATYDAPRAEAATSRGARPDDAVVIEEGPILTVFPTKLALAPRAARLVLDRIGSRSAAASDDIPAPCTEAPPVAATPWDIADWRTP